MRCQCHLGANNNQGVLALATGLGAQSETAQAKEKPPGGGLRVSWDLSLLDLQAQLAGEDKTLRCWCGGHIRQPTRQWIHAAAIGNGAPNQKFDSIVAFQNTAEFQCGSATGVSKACIGSLDDWWGGSSMKGRPFLQTLSDLPVRAAEKQRRI